MKDKWRPSLRLVVLAILLTVLALPLASLFFFRLYENQLVRQTEAELIAQGATTGAFLAHEVRKAALPMALLGAVVPSVPPDPDYGRYAPVEPRLDLTVDATLAPRPDGTVPRSATDPAFLAIGQELQGVLADAQRATLAGFRLLDPQGTVIAGGSEIGLSLAAIPEVRAALEGHYASALRRRVSTEPDPPLYSISRGTRIRVFVAMPVIVEGRVAGAVYLSRTPNNIVKHLYGERGKVALAGASLVGATLLIAFVFLRTISRPMRELRDRTALITMGDTTALSPLTHHGTREMAELATAFLEMARKLQTRSDAVRTFATHLSHELKSPLTAIGGAAELLRDAGGTMDEAKRHRFHDNIIADAARLDRMVRRLIELTRAESTDPGDETSTVEEALLQVPPRAVLTIAIDGDADLRLRIAAESFGIVLGQLIDNAAQHGASRLSVRTERMGGQALITAKDDGSGISIANQARIFEPFFTTRRDSGGTGLGLDIVVAVLKAHQGTIELAETEVGTSFRILLPSA